MSGGYLVRLALLSLASFFVLQLALGLAVRLFTPAILRLARRMGACAASDLLLAVRLGPPVVALGAALAWCVPGYLRYEPYGIEEPAGFALLALAALGALLCLLAPVRGVLALRRSRVAHGAPVLRLVGILSPKVAVCETVRAALSEEQWNAVLRHEQAHCASLDNLKRLLMLLAPGLAPFDRGWQPLEQAWAESTERAADEAACDGDSTKAMALAEALVRVARLGLEHNAGAPVSSFASSPGHLRDRVQLLLAEPVPRPSGQRWILPACAAALTMLLCLGQVWLQDVHQWMELFYDLW